MVGGDLYLFFIKACAVIFLNKCIFNCARFKQYSFFYTV